MGNELYCDDCDILIPKLFLSDKIDFMKFRNKVLCRKCGNRHRENKLKQIKI